MQNYVEIDLPNREGRKNKVLHEIDVTFFVPCYNEELNVKGTVDAIESACKIVGLSFEIIVFDDGSIDRTAEVIIELAALSRDLPLRLLKNHVNQGLARNFIDAAFEGHGKYYRLVCGDNVEPMETLIEVLRRAGQADIIIPYHVRVEGRPLHRKLISRLYTWLVNRASGRNLQYYNGLPLFHRRDVLRFHVEATGLGFQAEFLLRLLQEGRTFMEVPLVAHDKAGSLALNFRNFVSVGHTLFKISTRRLSNYLFKKR